MNTSCDDLEVLDVEVKEVMLKSRTPIQHTLQPQRNRLLNTPTKQMKEKMIQEGMTLAQNQKINALCTPVKHHQRGLSSDVSTLAPKQMQTPNIVLKKLSMSKTNTFEKRETSKSSI